jgi:hypothetical protein
LFLIIAVPVALLDGSDPLAKDTAQVLHALLP